ncbi:MAG: tRNA (N6-isopentenyl adenosine(37)-C2)-methylthiotransferase MiaB [Candidatus Delongbacteria bacterium]|nr:tRNA (N6-isopentenyl adenosine(37)-C2)-methylthiotransferase MiaB [Candidatus Delongbacteria bacterium]MCG2760929.1 tRNA (N6-isopentenyl adenosine(37)-C2)-methylthiotransferase MiaB [Candidatus Delongbacteria bacterium]
MLTMKFFIETFGCQMNVYDSELVTGILIKNGYEQISNINKADILFLNTCAIREKAVERVIHKMEQYAHLKKKGDLKIAGVLGCIPQYSSDRLKKELPFIDILSGPDNYDKLPQMISECLKNKKIQENLELNEEQNYDDILPFIKNKFSSFVTIMRGCNNFCSYCVVPYVRGRERSRSAGSILRETSDAVSKGITEITLLGQNVNSYKSEGVSFPALLEKVSEIEGLKRLRFATSHPKDISDELIKVTAENKKICKHLHLPFQAGSNEVLKRMNRGYTKDEYLIKIENIRNSIPEIALTTDTIVGFPDETEEDFLQTLEVIEQAGFDNSFMFIYSEREHTYAKKNFKDNISKKIKSERLKKVAELQKKIGLEQIGNDVGKTKEILVESVSKKRKTEMMGRTGQNRIVIFESDDTIKAGDYINVHITGAEGVSLFGEIRN